MKYLLTLLMLAGIPSFVGANTIPLTLLIDAQGRVLEKVRGAQDWDSRDIIKAIGQTYNIEM